uniref:FCP1 homology domain-containing protein n=1 Tax=Kalanchoe fedtschenkoi TaxID=63787 RepID=A0A7N0TH60_KALFE
MASAAAELAQAEMYSPKSIQVWSALVNWFAFVFQIFVQFLRATPSVSQVFPSVLGSGRQSFLAASAPAFRPLPDVELLDNDEAVPSAVEISDGLGSSSNSRRLEKLTVVLDLDETLVCAYETSSLPAGLRTQAIEAGITCFDLQCVSSEKESEGKPKINYVTVFERPGLHEFLKQLSKFAELVLFTAGLEGYARPLVDIIDAEKVISLRLYRPSTVSTEHREHVKDLTFISKDLRRIVIVDNNPFSFILQPVNGIPCVPFSAGQPHDAQLLDVLLPLLKHLSQQKDVRSVLYDKFRMPEWFREHGIPTSSWP